MRLSQSWRRPKQRVKQPKLRPKQKEKLRLQAKLVPEQARNVSAKTERQVAMRPYPSEAVGGLRMHVFSVAVAGRSSLTNVRSRRFLGVTDMSRAFGR